MKRPTLGRPRGRPPGSTKFNQSKLARGRSPLTNPYSWTKPLYPTAPAGFDYFKHYQDELIRQYSQSQFSNMFSAGLGMSASTAAASALINPSTTSTASNQLLNATLLQQLTAGMNPTNQLSQALSQMSPNLLKQTLETLGSKMSVPNPSPLLAGLSADKFIQLAALGQQASSKTSKAATIAKPKTKVTSSHQGQKLSTAGSSAVMSNVGFKYPSTTEVKRKQSKPKTQAPGGYASSKEIPPAHSTSTASLSMDKSNS